MRAAMDNDTVSAAACNATADDPDATIDPRIPAVTSSHNKTSSNNQTLLAEEPPQQTSFTEDAQQADDTKDMTTDAGKL